MSLPQLTNKELLNTGLSYDLYSKMQRCEAETKELAYTAGIYTKVVRIMPEALGIISQQLNERINRRTRLALDLITQAKIQGLNAEKVSKIAKDVEKAQIKLEKAIDAMIEQQTRYRKHIFDVEIQPEGNAEKSIINAETIELVRHISYWSGIEARTIEKETNYLEDTKERYISQSMRMRRVREDLLRDGGKEAVEEADAIIKAQIEEERKKKEHS